ncbi:MAG: hypothetical protein M5U12_05265 [Verrucomicrobia bacterium]|nr:hypothetical protein [Verrucomicrobiota bacterium]
MGKPPVIDVEVVTDEPRAGYRRAGEVGGAPVHPLAALLLVTVDNLWMFADWNAMTWFLTVPLSFATVAVPTFLIQKLVKGDGFLRAARLGILLGALAAIPTSLFGTPVGLALLAWSGLHKILGQPGTRKGP